MRRRGVLQAKDPGFWEVRRGCLDDFKPGKRLLPRGLQMHRQAPLFTQHWLIYWGEEPLLFVKKESGSRRRRKWLNEFLHLTFCRKINWIWMWSWISFLDHAAWIFSRFPALKVYLECFKRLCCSSFQCFSQTERLTYRWICLDFKSPSASTSDSWSSAFYCQVNTEDSSGQLQQRDQRQPLPSLLTYLFIFLFSSSLGERGETSPLWHPPSCGNGFPGPLLCQLLAAVVLQSKRCRNPFSGQCLWFRMLLPVCLWVCVAEKER